MAKPEIILIGGHAYRWQEICQLRRQQLWNAAQPRQLALFERKADRRPATERSAAGRYAEPDLFRGHARAPIKRGMIANSLSYRPRRAPHHPGNASRSAAVRCF